MDSAVSMLLFLAVVWMVLFTANRKRNGAATTTDAEPTGEGLWKPFWTDLKATATKPNELKSTLQKAYGGCVLLFAAATLPMPYEYYLSLRVGVWIALYFFLIAAYRQRETKIRWLVAIAGLAVLYNPILPVHLGVQLVWTAINVATIYMLFRAKLALDGESLKNATSK